MVILFDQYHLPDDVFEIIFATDQQVIVAKLLIEHMKSHDGIIGKTEMSLFATRLHEGTLEEEDDLNIELPIKSKKLSYNKRQFYDRILTPMKTMGLVDYDMYKKVYKISDKFNKVMIKVGLMWIQEINRRSIY